MKLKKKATKEVEVKEESKQQYSDLRQVMDYTVPFELIYSGVENESYFDILYSLGIRNFLMSYHYIQNKHLSLAKRFEDKKVRLFIDSGAHTYQNDPKYLEVTVEEWEKHLQGYLKWAEKNKDYIFAIASFDFENLVGPQVVDRWNKEYLEPFMLRTGIPVCFVWHQNSFNSWDYYCKRYPYVGFSSVNTEGVSIELNEYRSKLRVAEKYDSLVHGFGMTRTGMLTELPFYTSDSTTWLVGLQYGEVNFWTGTKMTRLKKDVWKTPQYLNIFSEKYGLNKESLENEEVTEIIKANALAFIDAEEYIQTRLRSMMYWLKAKAQKIDVDSLPPDFYPSPDWVLGGETDFDLKEKAKSMNINPDYEQVDVVVADMTMFMNWYNPEYKEAREFYEEEDCKTIKDLHDTYVNRIVSSVDEMVNDLIEFYKGCLSGDDDKLLQLGTNFDRVVKERDKYIEESNEELVDLTDNEVRERVTEVLKMDNLLTEDNSAPEIDELDDEIFKKANILPIRDERGRLVKGQTTIRKPKKVYSEKYPKFACDTCLQAANCPEYKSGYVCAYNKMFKRFSTRDMSDLIDLMQGMVEQNVARMQMAMIQETMSGNVGDPVVTNFINQNMNLINTLISLQEKHNNLMVRHTRSVDANGNSQETLEVTNPQSGGILEKIFSGMGSKSEDVKEPKNDSDIIED